MLGQGEFEPAKGETPRAAGVESMGFHALSGEVLGDLEVAHDGRAVPSCQGQGVADMIVVPVGEQDVIAGERLRGDAVWTAGVVGQKWVDDNARGGRFDEKCGVPEVGELHCRPVWRAWARPLPLMSKNSWLSSLENLPRNPAT